MCAVPRGQRGSNSGVIATAFKVVYRAYAAAPTRLTMSSTKYAKTALSIDAFIYL